MLYTTNAIESLHLQLRKALKIRGHFPDDKAATKLFFLVLRHISRCLRQTPQEWNPLPGSLHPDRVDTSATGKEDPSLRSG